MSASRRSADPTPTSQPTPLTPRRGRRASARPCRAARRSSASSRRITARASACPEGAPSRGPQPTRSWSRPRCRLTARAGHAPGAVARRAIEPALGRWGNPSGFLELGESAQEGARRETEEETELRVEVGRLIGVYSRPHAGVVTIAFEATVVGGRPEPAAETSEVRAFGPDEIPWDELAFSTAETALRDWVAGLPGRVPVRAGALRRGRPRRSGHLAAHRNAGAPSRTP